MRPYYILLQVTLFPLSSVQTHTHGPELPYDPYPSKRPLTQTLLDGKLLNFFPLSEPQDTSPLTIFSARQATLLPPTPALQIHDQGPEPETEVGVPALQSPDVGFEANEAPWDDPQTPFTITEVLFALQPTVLPPLEPLHLHDQGPEPETEVGVPALQSPDVGFEANETP